MSSSPKITLITPVRNGAAFIDRCLHSVTSQGYDNLEYIVLDAASTDGTQDIIKRYQSHIAYFASRPDKGANDSIMQGYKMARGDIVGLVMADDWLSPGALTELAAMYKARPDAEMFCFGMQEYRLAGTGPLMKTKAFEDPPGEVFTLLDGLYCQGVNRYYSRDLITKEGYYRDAIYPNLADRDYYIRLGLLRVKKAWTNKVLYNFLTHPGSNSTGGTADKIVRFLDETVRMAEDYLQRPDITDKERAQLRRWYCFNKLRSLYFRVRAHDMSGAMKGGLSMLKRYPVQTVGMLADWKMPEPYRAKASS